MSPRAAGPSARVLGARSRRPRRVRERVTILKLLGALGWQPFSDAMEYLNSVGTGAVDTMRGVAGFETGRWEAYTVEFAAPTLGLVFNDDGCVCRVLARRAARAPARLRVGTCPRSSPAARPSAGACASTTT